MEDCEVPETNVLEARERAGSSRLRRRVGLGAPSGARRPCRGRPLPNLDACARYANERHQFNRPIRARPSSTGSPT